MWPRSWNMHPYIHCSTIHNSQDMEATCVHRQEWRKKMWYIYIYIHTHTYTVEYYSHKKEWNDTTYSIMNRPRDNHTKWSKSEREKQIPWYHLYLEPEIWHKWTYPNKLGRQMGPRVASGSHEAGVPSAPGHPPTLAPAFPGPPSLQL